MLPKLPLSNQITEVRQKVLKPYFSPGVESEIKFTDSSIQQYRENGSRLRGFVDIKIPKSKKKNCFTITTTSPTRKDIIVCKSQSVPFYLEDLDRLGRLFWKIKTGPEDYSGTDLVWQTPYRSARFVKENDYWPGESRKILVNSCRLTKDRNHKFKILVELMDGESWIFYIPKSEKKTRESGYQIKQNTSFDLEKTRDPKHFLSNRWEIPARSSYELKPDHIVGYNNLPGGKTTGGCRYQYKKAGVPWSAVECKGLYPYKWIHIPLICLKRI